MEKKKSITSELRNLKEIIDQAGNHTCNPSHHYRGTTHKVPVFNVYKDTEDNIVESMDLFYDRISKLEISAEHAYLDRMGEGVQNQGIDLLDATQEKSHINSGIIDRVIDMRSRLEYRAARIGYNLSADVVLLTEKNLHYEDLGSPSLPMYKYIITGTLETLKKITIAPDTIYIGDSTGTITIKK